MVSGTSSSRKLTLVCRAASQRGGCYAHEPSRSYLPCVLVILVPNTIAKCGVRRRCPSARSCSRYQRLGAAMLRPKSVSDCPSLLRSPQTHRTTLAQNLDCWGVQHERAEQLTQKPCTKKPFLRTCPSDPSPFRRSSRTVAVGAETGAEQIRSICHLYLWTWQGDRRGPSAGCLYNGLTCPHCPLCVARARYEAVSPHA